MVRRAARDGFTTLIHVGDLAVLWLAANDDDKFTRLLVRWPEKHAISMLFIDGNHDVHPKLRALPLNGEGFGVISERLLYAPRGHRWEMEGLRFGALGGAYSVDRRTRKLGKSWWEGEEVTEHGVVRLGSEPLDVLIAHEVPVGIDVVPEVSGRMPEDVERAAYHGRMLVRDAVRNTEPKRVFSGHWHQPRRSGIVRSGMGGYFHRCVTGKVGVHNGQGDYVEDAAGGGVGCAGRPGCHQCSIRARVDGPGEETAARFTDVERPDGEASRMPGHSGDQGCAGGRVGFHKGDRRNVNEAAVAGTVAQRFSLADRGFLGVVQVPVQRQGRVPLTGDAREMSGVVHGVQVTGSHTTSAGRITAVGSSNIRSYPISGPARIVTPQPNLVRIGVSVPSTMMASCGSSYSSAGVVIFLMLVMCADRGGIVPVGQRAATSTCAALTTAGLPPSARRTPRPAGRT